jgi:predicted acylesterase/phospholipase RssA
MKTGLFLTPGAARTAYQVGAVDTLVHEGGIDFDVVAATSVGALNGAFVATGQSAQLVELWSSWKDKDIFSVDLRTILRGGLLWAPNLMHNHPQRHNVIDRYLAGVSLPAGRRFRINLANLTFARSEIFEWPGAAQSLPDGVDASVAVPGAIRPKKIAGSQYADGLTIDGCPLEPILLTTGVDRAFVVGVTPQARRPDAPNTAFATFLAAAEWNQYTETTRGLAESRAINELAERWEAAHDRVRDAIVRSETDAERRDQLLAEVDAVFERHRSGRRHPVEIVAILPDHHTKMFFTSYRPERSRRLIEEGRQDARAALAMLADRD